jgi:hypothetical protein
METIPSAIARARLWVCVLMAGAIALAGCTREPARAGASPETYNRTFGKLTGRVTRGPTSPVSGPGIKAPPIAPVGGAELRIFDSKGAIAATARTDPDGFYRLSLPPGIYRVERGGGFTGAARNLPTMVAISPGGETRLDVWVDTGIRASAGGPAAIR